MVENTSRRRVFSTFSRVFSNVRSVLSCKLDKYDQFCLKTHFTRFKREDTKSVTLKSTVSKNTF